MKRKWKKYPSVGEVTDAQRINMVKDIFSTVTDSYDFLNHFLSLRQDIGWRRFAVRTMRFFETYRLLDIAVGTADLAIEAARKYPSIQVAGLDFSHEMIRIGRKKIEKEALSDRVQLFQGDALDLPFSDGRFDAASIAFGVRNIPDKIRALKEMERVVVPGGQVIILEMASPRNRYIKGIYHSYLNRILPRLAKVFSRNPAAYHYLTDSIVHFPPPEIFRRMMEKVGLTKVEIHSLTFGITYLFIGYKPGACRG
jgi:demethylmenaquinone methyltransferase/2-methoxy-6-polyprenyl-1,4-benzoquinol methylase